MCLYKQTLEFIYALSSALYYVSESLTLSQPIQLRFLSHAPLAKKMYFEK